MLQRLGPYEIIASIGSGGMGEVFRARDPRIGRDVAVKVLPSTFVENPDRLHRFEQEARAAGALNHPNLVTIYDLGRENGAPYIVMELLEGHSLRRHLADGPVGPRKAIEYGVQIANGLAAAHDRGIVHRDLKPDNIFVTNDGRVKILDFGLAKLETTSDAPSLTAATAHRDTTPGTVMGTVGYMSPEQVRGQQVDHRTDIFAFGAILYEMLAGHRAFAGDSAADTMSAILKEEPAELSGEHSKISPSLDRIVRRCLEKNREERFHSAHDVAFALEAVAGSSSGIAERAIDEPRKIRTRTLFAIGALAVAAIAFLIGRGTRPSAAPATPSAAAPRYTQLTFQLGTETQPALSPDGKLFAYVGYGSGNADLYVQRVDGQTAINITKESLADDLAPAFSPDGGRIAFCRREGGIFVVGATGESLRRLTDIGVDPSWSPDGKEIVFSTEWINRPTGRNSTSQLWVVDVASGTKRKIYDGDAVQPRWSPHGQRIAFWTLRAGGARDLATIPAKGGPPVDVNNDPELDWNPAWSPDGKFLYFLSDRNGPMNVWRVAIDENSGAVSGAIEPFPVPADQVSYISFSSDGRMLYSATIERSFLKIAPFDPTTARVGERSTVFAGSLNVRSPAISPDAKWIAFTTEAKNEDLFVIAADGTGLRQLTNDAHRDRGVAWTPDGSLITFYSNREGSYSVWTIRPDGSDLAKIAAIANESLWYPRWSPDGSKISAVSFGTTFIIDVRGKTPPLEIPVFWSDGWSPDGRSLIGNRGRGGFSPIAIYDIETKEIRTVRHNGDASQWLKDGRRVLIADFVKKEVVLVDLGSGEERVVTHLEGSPVGDNPFHLTPDNRWILFRHRELDSNVWIVTPGADSPETNL